MRYRLVRTITSLPQTELSLIFLFIMKARMKICISFLKKEKNQFFLVMFILLSSIEVLYTILYFAAFHSILLLWLEIKTHLLSINLQHLLIQSIKILDFQIISLSNSSSKIIATHVTNLKLLLKNFAKTVKN